MWQSLPDIPPATFAPPDMISSWWLNVNVTVFTWHSSSNPCSIWCDLQLIDVTECDSLYPAPLPQLLLHLVWSPVDRCDWSGTIFTWHPSCNPCSTWDHVQLIAVLSHISSKFLVPIWDDLWNGSLHPTSSLVVLIPLTAVRHGRLHPDCCETWQSSSHWLLWDMAVLILTAVRHGRPHPTGCCETWQSSSHWLLSNMAVLIPLAAVRHSCPHPTGCCETWHSSSHWLLWDMAVLIPLAAVRHSKPHPDCCDWDETVFIYLIAVTERDSLHPTPHPVRCRCHLQHSHTPSCQMPVPPPTFPHLILSDASATSNIPTPDPVRCQCHLQHSHTWSCQMPVPLPTFPTPHPVRLFVKSLFPPPSNLHPRPHPLSQPMVIFILSTAVTETGWS